MKILLIGINFGGYELRIVEEMTKQGHEVCYKYDANPYQSFFIRMLGKEGAKRVNTIYQTKTLESIGDGFGQVIVLVGRQLRPEFLKEVRKRNSKAIFSLYLWDDVKRVENFEATKSYYDNIYSFDLHDCDKYGFKHLPLFYSQRPGNCSEKTYDIYSAMFAHSEREAIVSRINEQAMKADLSALFYISLGRYLYLKRMIRLKKMRQGNIRYIAAPIPENENYYNMESAKTILDVQFTGQTGLTMRTIESLGMCNKIITTNDSIKRYDFYDANNIMVIDRANPMINVGFFYKPYHNPEDVIYEKYSLTTWVKTITMEIDTPIYTCRE